MNRIIKRCYEEDENFLENKKVVSSMSTDEINKKYELGHNRIITENGSLKLSAIMNIFSNDNYVLKPKYQRRVNWDDKKRSKLIESFIINIPIPPIFLCEVDFDYYEVMDGLQRLSTIIDFYENKFELSELEEWSELNGMRYEDLPQKIKEGIDRRQLTTITLLKESSQSPEKSIKITKMVFERLNSGGVKLEAQEMRNALYPGVFNDLCFELTKNKNFIKLFNIIIPKESHENYINFENEEDQDIIKTITTKTYNQTKMYSRMLDVELVLRFFAMTQVDKLTGTLQSFLDNYLIFANSLKNDDIEKKRAIFNEVMQLAYDIFGKKAFCSFKNSKLGNEPMRYIYDPMCISILNNLEQLKVISEFKAETNCRLLLEMYKEEYDKNNNFFNGKKQSKSDIAYRVECISSVILKIQGN